MEDIVQKLPKYYLYRHIRHDKNEVFYVGIGKRRVIDTSTNITYDSIKDLCLITGIPDSTLSRWLKNNNTKYKFL